MEVSSSALIAPPSPQKPNSICYGRVDDIEKLVPANWWKTVFADEMYLKTDGDVVEDPEITKHEIAMLEADEEIHATFIQGSKLATDEASRTAPCAKILDLCCGQGRHTIHLAEKYPHLQIHGHDQSSYLISLARERASSLGISSRTVFTEGDCRQIPYPQETFDLIIVMGNSFGYFADDHGDESVLAEILRVLKPGGNLILDLTDGSYMRDNYAERSWEWIDDNTFVCRERTLSKDRCRLNSREVITVTTKGVIRDQFYQERLYSRNEVISLLENAKFSFEGIKTKLTEEEAARSEVPPSSVVGQEGDEDKHSDTASMKEMGVAVITSAKELSKRGEDLGMMEQRMLLKAIKPTTSSSRTGAEQLKVDVLLTKPKKVCLSEMSTADSTPSLESGTDSEKTEHRIYQKMMNDLTISSATSSNADDGSPASASSDRDLKDMKNYHSSTTNSTSLKWLSTYQSSATASNSIPKPPIDTVTVIMGDTSIPCFGKLNNNWNKEDFITREKAVKALYELGFETEKVVLLDRHTNLYQRLMGNPPGFILNLCDEGYENDANKELHVPALLDTLHLDYTGAGPNCLAFCYDKGIVNRAAEAVGISTPREIHYISTNSTGSGDNNNNFSLHDIEQLDQIISSKIGGYPAFIKPIKGDNSLGITSRSIVNSKSELVNYIRELDSQLGIRDILVQEYLTGSEYGVGMVGNVETGFHFFPILEVDYTNIINLKLPPILGFESKWDPSSPYWSEIQYKRACLSPSVESKLKETCKALWKRFGFRDYGRFDFRCDVGKGDGYGIAGGEIKLLEVNPNPGWCWDGKFTLMAQMDGYQYRDVLGMIMWAAHDRIEKERRSKHQQDDGSDKNTRSQGRHSFIY